MTNIYKYKLGQYFNISGLTFVLKHIFYYKSKPNYIVKKTFGNLSFDEIDYYLKNANYVLIDKDNTITKPYSNYIESNCKENLNYIQNKIGYNNVMIVSNSIGSSDDTQNRIENYENLFNTKILKHDSKKPKIKKDVILRNLNINSENLNKVIVIGDRLMVDVYFSKKLDAQSLLVLPIDTSKENFVVRFIRYFENLINRHK